MRRLLGLCAASTIAVGCSSSGDGGDLSVPRDLSALLDLSVADHRAPADLGYPGGPYDAFVGTTLPDFQFPGYYVGLDTSALADTHPFGTTTFDQIRGSGARYAMLMLADFW